MVDFDNSIIQLRLDDMAEGEFSSFSFTPWPEDYSPQPSETEITSVQINFVGNRARLGFHFKVTHKDSRFKISQDVINELRSQKYPRQKQDKEFLKEAREILLKSFTGNAEKDLRILSIDLGTSSGSAGLFIGKKFQKSFPLKLIKLDKLYTSIPKADDTRKEKKSKGEQKKEKQKGLSVNHVVRHLDSWSTGASEITKKRDVSEQQLADFDMRRLSLHIRWMIRDWVRLNTSQIIEIAENENVDLIVFESMRGFIAPGYEKIDDPKKRRLAFFSAGRIRRKTTEKAVERGMRTITVPYENSSQVCSSCGRMITDDYKSKWQKNKRKGFFICEYLDCAKQFNSDENAALVLGRVFWGEIDLKAK